MSEIKIVRHWDSLPVVVQSAGETFSTRVLEWKYRKMEDALSAIANNGMDARQCRDMAGEVLAEVRK